MASTLRLYDYVNTLITIPNQNISFAILCDKYPINLGRGTYLARVLYVSLSNKDNGEVTRIYPDKLHELNLEHVIIKSTVRRRINAGFHEFFINGNTIKQQYKDHDFYNYSIECINKTTLDTVNKLRAKYNIPEPTIFKGEHQELVLE